MKTEVTVKSELPKTDDGKIVYSKFDYIVREDKHKVSFSFNYSNIFL